MAVNDSNDKKKERVNIFGRIGKAIRSIPAAIIGLMSATRKMIKSNWDIAKNVSTEMGIIRENIDATTQQIKIFQARIKAFNKRFNAPSTPQQTSLPKSTQYLKKPIKIVPSDATTPKPEIGTNKVPILKDKPTRSVSPKQTEKNPMRELLRLLPEAPTGPLRQRIIPIDSRSAEAVRVWERSKDLVKIAEIRLYDYEKDPAKFAKYNTGGQNNAGERLRKALAERKNEEAIAFNNLPKKMRVDNRPLKVGGVVLPPAPSGNKLQNPDLEVIARNQIDSTNEGIPGNTTSNSEPPIKKKNRRG